VFAAVGMPPILITPRLVLRELTVHDAAFILELVNEPAFLEFIGDKGVRTHDDARRQIAERYRTHYDRHGFGLWAVVRKDTCETIGICGLLKRDVLDHPDLGYALLQRHTGQGYATEAVAATLAHAREKLGHATLHALTALENPASIALLGKFGFRHERILDLPGYPGPSRVWTSGPAQSEPARYG